MRHHKYLICNLLTVLFCFSCYHVSAQKKQTYMYAVKDTSKLYMDVYLPDKQNERKACMFFVFGGGYIGGARDDSQIQMVKKHYIDKGYVVIGIDYRLGLKDADNFNIVTGVKNYERAVRIATEDLISAIAFTLDDLNATGKISINPDNIVVMGSSAGAITALQADYAICNGLYNTSELPDTFNIAGVISYSGAIFSTKGGPKYRNHAPAPTFFCHGTEDRLVIYNKIQLFNLGLFGSDYLARKFDKKGYGYHIRRHVGLGHQVAGFYQSEFDEIDVFLEKVVFGNRKIQIDETCYDPDIKPMYLKFKIRDLETVK